MTRRRRRRPEAVWLPDDRDFLGSGVAAFIGVVVAGLLIYGLDRWFL